MALSRFGKKTRETGRVPGGVLSASFDSGVLGPVAMKSPTAFGAVWSSPESESHPAAAAKLASPPPSPAPHGVLTEASLTPPIASAARCAHGCWGGASRQSWAAAKATLATPLMPQVLLQRQHGRAESRRQQKALSWAGDFFLHRPVKLELIQRAAAGPVVRVLQWA
jgi:hypothetical protein